MGDGGSGDAVVPTPGAAVEDAGEGGEQDVAPVEEGGALVEMREAEDGGRDEQGGGAADAALEEVLHPAAEEDFFGQRDADEGEDPRGDDEPGMVNVAMEVEEAEGEAQGNRDGEVEEKFAEAGGPVACAKAEVEADGGEAADGEEGVEAGVEESKFAEEAEFVRPRSFEPTKIDREAEGNEDEDVEKMAALAGVEARGKIFERGDEHGREEINEEPAEREDVRAERDDQVGEDEDCGQYESHVRGK